MKTRSKPLFNLFMFFVLLTALIGSGMTVTPAYADVPTLPANVCAVNIAAGGTNDGLSWTNAYTSLQSALVNVNCTEIWVAAGTYKPHASNKAASFVLKNGVSIYGGFSGTEALRTDRAPATNTTFLDGDLLGDDINALGEAGDMDILGSNSSVTNRDDNSEHVVVANGTNNTAVLDGFTITNGFAISGGNGAGLYVNGSGAPTLANLVFEDNHALNAGGGIFYSSNGGLNLTNATFSYNSAGDYGGGLYILGGGINNITNGIFSANSISRSGALGSQGAGGGIFSDGVDVLNVTNGTFSNHSSFSHNPASVIFKSRGTLNVTGSQISNNAGTGIVAQNATVTIDGGVISDNDGGAAFNGGTKNVKNSSFTNNSPDGGIANMNGTLTVTASTFSGNADTYGVRDFGGTYVWGAGGAIDNTGGTLTVINSTFSANSAQADLGGPGNIDDRDGPTKAGGIYNYGGSLTALNNTFFYNVYGIYNIASTAFNLKNNIFFSKFIDQYGDAYYVDCLTTAPITSQGNNLVSATGTNACGLSQSNGNIYSVDPKLGALSNNGGPTQTHPLLPGSRAIDAGNSAVCADGSTVKNLDQRGIARPAGACDIGAFESNSQRGQTLTVNTSADTDDGICDPLGLGDQNCTLREAINTANILSGANTVTFAGDYTITLAGSQLPIITTPITITGTGAANTIVQANAVSGVSPYRIFEVSAAGNLTLDSLTVSNGGNGDCVSSCAATNLRGAGVGNAGILTVKNSVFTGNKSLNMAGAIYNTNSLTVTNSTFSNNSANNGGGIVNTGTAIMKYTTFVGNTAGAGDGGAVKNSGSLTLTNATLSGNSATGYGGGLYNSSTATLTNNTFSANSATTSGGGLYNTSTLNLKNSILANSTGGDCVSTLAVASSAKNLIKDTGSNACGLSADNIIGSDPNLGALANNGGITQTHALQSGSPAIDAGSNTGCPANDQRGVSRPQNVTCDIGAYEFEGAAGENATRYAVPGGMTSGACDSWNAACELRYAIFVSIPGDEIWVKAGTYTPAISDRAVSFKLKSGVGIYGGFAETETLFSQRNPAANITILSGDLNGDDLGFNNNTENSYHVVDGSGVDETAILDGFTIKGGNANHPWEWPHYNGGGVINYQGKPSLSNLTITGNYAANGGGGMINDANSDMLMFNVTFTGNSAGEAGGGGLLNWGATNLTLNNITIAKNSATTAGGGLINYYSSMSLSNTTIANNTAPNGGGGVQSYGAGLTLKNTIIASNTNGDCAGTLESGSTNNLIGNASSACGLTNETSDNNIIGQDPKLRALSSSGKVTPTMALNSGSPAIDSGTNDSCFHHDQRGISRPQNGTCDMGAVEYIPIIFAAQGGAASGLCATWATACNLQYAISIANAGGEIWVKAGTHKPDASDRAVSFQLKNNVAIYGGFAGAETLFGQRNPAANVTILSGDIGTISDETDNSYHVVNGSNTDNTAVLDGFTITGGYADGSDWPDYNGGGVINYQGNPTLSNLTITGNYAFNGGGGMINDQNSGLSMTNVTFTNNSAGIAAGGGGMLNWIATNLKISNVTFSGNYTEGSGGGLINYGGNQSLINVTFYNNSADGSGGGLSNNGGSQSLINVTFSGNAAVVDGGNLAVASGTTTLINSILANGFHGRDCYGTISSASNNLIQSNTFACGLTNGVNGNIIGSGANLGALADNGGATQTMALLVDSPAIDAGNLGACPSDDQRGMLRPQGTQCDIGAFELEQFYISGSAGIAGATLSYKGGITQSAITDVNGNYRFYVPANWSGTVTPDIAGYAFFPTIKSYSKVTANRTAQNYSPREILPYSKNSLESADGWTLESSENSNIANTKMNIGNLRVGDDAKNKQYRSLLYFDTASLPNNAVISKAIVKIKMAGTTKMDPDPTPSTDPFTTHGNLVADMKKGAFGLAALEAGDFSALAAPINTAGKFYPSTPPDDWYTLTLNSANFKYINLTGATQFRVRFIKDDNNDKDADYITFYGDGSGVNAPQFVIEYSLP